MKTIPPGWIETSKDVFSPPNKASPLVIPVNKRIRQSDKPLLNKLESEFLRTIQNKYPNYPPIRSQEKRFRLCNGVTYTPDFTCSLWPDESGGPARETAWEIKGEKAWDDAIVKIKMAPTIWPEIIWLFCWKEDGVWKTQMVLS